MANWLIRDPKKDYRGYHYMTCYELLEALKKLNPEWLAGLVEQSQSDSWESLTVNELKKRLLLVELQLQSMSHIGNEMFEDAPLTGTIEEQRKKLELRKIKLRLEKSIKKYYEENPELAVQSASEAMEVGKLIEELLAVELQLQSISHIGNEIFVDAPLTGTIEEQTKKRQLQSIRSKLKDAIVNSFKNDTDMSTIPPNKKRFLYSEEEFKSIKKPR